MNLVRVLALLVLAAIITVGLTLIFVNPEDALPKGTQSVAYVYSVAEAPGFDVASDIFRLGAVTPGGSSASRSLTIDDPLGAALNRSTKFVRILAEGEGSEYLVIDPQQTAVPVIVNITVKVPPGTPYGEYKGNLLIIPLTTKAE